MLRYTAILLLVLGAIVQVLGALGISFHASSSGILLSLSLVALPAGVLLLLLDYVRSSLPQQPPHE